MEQVLDIILERLGRIEEKQDKTLEQTTRTNGRVTRLEKDSESMWNDLDKVKDVQAQTKGRDKVIWIVGVAIATVIGYAIASFFK
jgi:hypothetical protein